MSVMMRLEFMFRIHGTKYKVRNSSINSRMRNIFAVRKLHLFLRRRVLQPQGHVTMGTAAMLKFYTAKIVRHAVFTERTLLQLEHVDYTIAVEYAAWQSSLRISCRLSVLLPEYACVLLSSTDNDR
ncbi:hypothetical protein EVAR_61062_1 [Eumeta japonica]|uniref:Uncharacterized protein n=1 Tax=Eumeta variegata TaxID=151549 RepID=A0A4C1Z712_EUMVA|nr:hypothetical protein EVAR_61062_1 [Eumeta japonica]